MINDEGRCLNNKIHLILFTEVLVEYDDKFTLSTAATQYVLYCKTYVL